MVPLPRPRIAGLEESSGRVQSSPPAEEKPAVCMNRARRTTRHQPSSLGGATGRYGTASTPATRRTMAREGSARETYEHGRPAAHTIKKKMAEPCGCGLYGGARDVKMAVDGWGDHPGRRMRGHVWNRGRGRSFGARWALQRRDSTAPRTSLPGRLMTSPVLV